MTGRRRRGMLPPARAPQGYVPGAGKTVLVDGIPEGAIPNPEPVQTPTQVIVIPADTDKIAAAGRTVRALAGIVSAPIPEPAWMAEPEPAALTEVIKEGQEQAERGETEDRGSFAQYADEPVPDPDWDDPAVRTEWFRLHEGYETCFASVLNDHIKWLYLIGLDVPVSEKAPEAAEDTTDPGSVAAPPVREGAAETPALAAVAAEPVSTEDGEPVQDEPAAEPDCAEGGETA